MTLTHPQPAQAHESTALEPVALDLYRDIHKGIRSQLFEVTSSIGSLDPTDRAARTELAERMHRLADLLVSHAAHEDAAIEPALERHLPDLARRMAEEHHALEVGIDRWRLAGDEVVDVAAPAARLEVHRLYLDVASFTASYLEHQDTEERIVMPALERAIGVEAVVAIHGEILAAIPPDEMASSLAVMLPAMNVDDRTELLGGMRDGAPAEVFEGVWGLAGSVLTPADHRSVGGRLGIA